MKAPGLLIPLLLLAGPLSVAGQEPAPAGANVEGLEIGESIDVRVVNVEAVVTDLRGRRIQGLKPEDFRLLIDGREVPLDYFTEIRGGAAVEVHGDGPASPVAGAVGRNLLVFVDRSSTIQAHLELVLRRLEEDLDRLAPGDQIALVAAGGGGLEILTDWTSDTARVRSILGVVRRQPTGGALLRAALDSLENDSVLRNMVETGDAAEEGIPFREGLEVDRWGLGAAIRPGDRSTLERYSALAHDEAPIWVDDSMRAVVLAAMRAFASAPGRKVMLLLSGGWPGGPDPRVIEAANLLGYSLYPVDVTGLQTSPTDQPYNGGFITSPWERRVHYGLEVLARETGGKASLNGLRETALERALEDTESYYLLGFSPIWNADGSKHDIRLEVRGSWLRVRARRSYSDLSLKARQGLEEYSRRVIEAAGTEEP